MTEDLLEEIEDEALSEETKEIEESDELDDETIESIESPKMLRTHESIRGDLSGVLEKLQVGYAKVILETNDAMVADGLGLVHGGFIFSAADYAAMAVVNERNVVLGSAKSNFLSPVRVGDIVIVEAKATNRDGRKRIVNVSAYVHNIKVFEGEFVAIVLERHVLRLNLSKT